MRHWHRHSHSRSALVAFLLVSAVAIGQRVGAQEAGKAAVDPPEAEEVDPDAPQYGELKIPAVLDERGKQRQELTDTRRRAQDLQRQIVNVINGTAPLADNQKKFDGFFLQYFFPQITWLENIQNPANYNALYQRRNVFFRDYMRRSTLPDVRQYLLKITLAKMKEIETGNYHPASRVNAMLIIAELNTKETVQSGTPSPPEPYLDAFPVMVDALGDPQQLDAVKIAAMLGILRHVQWDSRQRDPRNPQAKKIDDALRDRANTLCLALLNAKQPPAGRSVDGHAWMQRRAIDILGVLGTIGTNVNATQTVDAMVADEKAPLSIRCTAAEALGQLDLPPETRLDPLETARKLGELALFVCKRETKRFEDEKAFLDEKRLASGGQSGGGGMMSGGMPGGMPAGAMPGAMPGGPGGGGAASDDDGPGAAGMPGMPGMAGMGGSKAAAAGPDHRLVIAQRRIRSQMQCVKVGLAGIQGKTTGIHGLAKDATHKELIQKLADEVRAIRDLSDDEKMKTVEKLMAEVKLKTQSLEKAMKLVAAASKPAAAKPADDNDGPGAPPAKKPATAAAPKAKPAADPAGGG